MSRETDGFLVCPEHGDIYWQQGVRQGDELVPSHVEAVHPDAPPALPGRPIVCFCGASLRPEFRPTVRHA